MTGKNSLDYMEGAVYNQTSHAALGHNHQGKKIEM